MQCTPMQPWVRDCSVGPSPPGLPVIVDRTGGASGSMLSTLEIGGKGETRGTCDVQCAGCRSVAGPATCQSQNSGTGPAQLQSVARALGSSRPA
jgi:hypothetical protein